MDDSRPVWERQPGEPTKAHAAFTVYCNLGEDRSLDRAYRKATDIDNTASGRWHRWCAEWNWVERAAEHDGHLREIERKAYERRFAQLARRRAQEEFALHDELLEECSAIRQMLRKAESAPLQDVVQEKEEDDLGLARRTTTRTKIKGLRQLSGYARLKETWLELRTKSVLGVRPAEKEKSSTAADQMPDFVIETRQDEPSEDPDTADQTAAPGI